MFEAGLAVNGRLEESWGSWLKLYFSTIVLGKSSGAEIPVLTYFESFNAFVSKESEG